MDAKKLKINIDKLKKVIPKKPANYTNDFPKSINASLHKYMRQRTISIMRYACWKNDKENWPLPLYVDPENIRIGYLNEFMFTKLGMNDFKYFDVLGGLQYNKYAPYKITPRFLMRVMWLLRYRQRKKLIYYDWLIVPILCHFFQVTNLDDFNLQLFDVNFRYFQTKILNNPILANKKIVLKEIFDSYKKGKYASSICTLYPIIDYITRNYFQSNNFSKDLTSVNAMFKAAGFDYQEIDNLKPGAATAKFLNMFRGEKITNNDWQKLSLEHEYNLGLPGVALSSFLHFSYQYYAYYRSDTINTKYLNRHAILHGADDQFGTRLNTVKLFTYLYLMLELEPVLKIIFNER